MNRTARMSVVLAAALALAPLAFLGCGGDEQAEAQAERDARLAELEQQKQELDAAREELAALEERLAQARGGELPEGEEVDATQLQTEVAQRDAQLTTLAEDLNGALVEFINADPPIEGEPLKEHHQRAFELKAQEDMVLAEEYITEGGDYPRAIRIYQDILTYAPDNERVKQALAHAEANRYMTQERFAQVQQGMTQNEVQALLGPVNFQNRRDFPDQGVVAWYYPKSPARDAAGVFFRERNDRWVVYRADFDAVKAAGDDGEG
ncbi:MAG TPA: hypothetical protein VLF66_07825 [Thermoanaerobaculia bacterium]|nr:hypothetical protein [Thermoanaerobaculia bacterium]